MCCLILIVMDIKITHLFYNIISVLDLIYSLFNKLVQIYINIIFYPIIYSLYSLLHHDLNNISKYKCIEYQVSHFISKCVQIEVDQNIVLNANSKNEIIFKIFNTLYNEYGLIDQYMINNIINIIIHYDSLKLLIIITFSISY